MTFPMTYGMWGSESLKMVTYPNVFLWGLPVMWGVAGSGWGGIVYKRWGVEWYHPCGRGMAGRGLGPPTRLLPKSG